MMRSPMKFLREATLVQKAGLAAGVLAFVAIATLDSSLHHDPQFGNRPALAAAAAALMAIWWLTEALPIHYTACVPLVLFPALGIFGGSFGNNLKESWLPYIDPYMWLFAGGMAIAAAMQQWNLHRRIALNIMAAIGTDPRRVLLGCLVATAFISMWISNTATAAMMMPIGLAIIAQMEAQTGAPRLRHFGMAIMLAIAYGANVGGIGTKIGTAPNSQFAGFAEKLGIGISFLQFLLVGTPFVLMFLPVVFFFLWRIGRHDRDAMGGASAGDIVAGELAKLGVVQRAESIVLAVFLATAALWIAGKPLTALLAPYARGFKLTSAHVEGGIAMAAAIVLFCWFSRGQQVLTVGALRQVPWETLLLLGGGFALAAGTQKSGLSTWAAGQLSAVQGLPPFSQVLVAAIATVAISAVATNTATIAVMLVVLRDAVTMPELLPTVLFAATIAASCDFALPVGTPPNAIVFGSGYVTIPRMARTGVVLDLLAAILAACWCYLVVPLVL
jgi:solute carrier family 13 (sodium-dependent dicarboxylate transporter), member 2/3/5